MQNTGAAAAAGPAAAVPDITSFTLDTRKLNEFVTRRTVNLKHNISKKEREKGEIISTRPQLPL
jgi:hypothetical protein